VAGAFADAVLASETLEGRAVKLGEDVISDLLSITGFVFAAGSSDLPISWSMSDLAI
jgi:hypothetical protein